MKIPARSVGGPCFSLGLFARRANGVGPVIPNRFRRSTTSTRIARHGTKIEDDVLFVETDDGWLEVGALQDIYALVGGHEYTIEYDPDAASVAWLDTAPDDTFTFDVRVTLADMSYTAETVDALANTPLDAGGEEFPRRTSRFADLMIQI